MSGLQLDKVNDEANLIDYLKNFVHCYDEKLTMFLKVRAMILALNDAMPSNPKQSFNENSIDVDACLPRIISSSPNNPPLHI